MEKRGWSIARAACILLAVSAAVWGQDKLRIIAIGAHPDDCDLGAGGTAIQYAKLGHAVKFVSLTNGDAGHQDTGGGALGKRRRAEAIEAGRRFGVEYEVLDNHDGELMPTLENRKEVIRRIRSWNADIVISPRINDYHPDHRYTGVLVQDAAYMVVVPNVCPDTPPLKRNPVFFYFQDSFQRPNPFRPDVAVDIDAVWEQKVNAMDVSQFYEWLPWVAGNLDKVPKDPVARRNWLSEQRQRREVTPAVREALIKWYGAERGGKIRRAEAFELCEYGRRPNAEELKRLFPMAK